MHVCMYCTCVHTISVRGRHEFSSTKVRSPRSDQQPKITRRTDAYGVMLMF